MRNDRDRAMQLGTRPNLSPPRNREKALNLLKLCDELTLFGERQISAQELTAKLGNQAKPLGRYLRLGLIRFGSYSVASKRAFSYRPNKEFCDQLRVELGLAKPTPAQIAKKAEKLFEPAPRTSWPKKGNRYYPWWTNMKSADRVALFLSQYPAMYDYDIEVARPTVLLHLYDRVLEEHHNVLARVSTGHHLVHWRALVADKRRWREDFAAQLGITYDQAKNIQQSVTNGGYVSTSPANPTCRELGPEKAAQVRENEMYKGLRHDFELARDILFKNTPKREIPSKLYHVYEKIEDGCMSIIDKHLRAKGEEHLWYVHDGFFSCHRQDTRELEGLIERKLGMKIRLEETIFTADPG